MFAVSFQGKNRSQIHHLIGVHFKNRSVSTIALHQYVYPGRFLVECRRMIPAD